MCAEQFGGGCLFATCRWAGEGSEVEAVDDCGGISAVGRQPLIGAFFDGSGEGFAVGMLHQAASGPIRMVRAALVKSDGLIRSLGRPNRDQIVTMRPTDLTTLQAIELANGETLAVSIEKGAKQWLPTIGESTTTVINRLYLAALSRPPTNDEQTTAVEMLGAQPTIENIQDLLWAVLMLPEFQLVR